MLYNFLLREPQYWILPWILQTIAYWLILGKMGLKKSNAIIPAIAEHEFTKLLFKRVRSFWRPFIIAGVFIAGAYYLGPSSGTGQAYLFIAFIVYGLFLARLYYRMARSFGKGRLFSVCMILMPTIFLVILAFTGKEFTPPQFREEQGHSKFINGLRNLTIAVLSFAEIALIVLAVGAYTVSTYPPRQIVKMLMDDTHSQTANIVSDGKAVSREDAMGASASKLADMKGSREHFFPDHSKDKNVVVLEYIIGANLEDGFGMASSNILMMKDATKRGDGLTFVLENGGSRRWFTEGVDDSSVARYTVKGGKVEKVMDLDGETCMTEPDNLADFISWGVKEYPADRYMLVLWDHGGGVPYGYGSDSINRREDEENFRGIRVSEVAQAMKKSGVKFDVVGFDACLMQDIEIANALEPYADYMLASEETEGSYGWFYTDGFGRLAENPGLSSAEFGKAMVSSYDQFNTTINDGEPKTDTTLSFVDLTMASAASDKLDGLLSSMTEAVRNNSGDFAELGLAASNAYSFSDDMQIDLIDFITKLNDTDMDDSIATQEEKQEVIDCLKASVLYRNKDSANGINGIALAFPYKAIYLYDDTQKELANLSAGSEKTLMDDVFSIMAVRQKKDSEADIAATENKFLKALKEYTMADYTKEDWYVEGFEEYETADAIVDIPLKETKDGYKIQLPEKTWGIITDAQTFMYQKDEEGRWRYLGTDQIGDDDENGHPMVNASDTWINMNGHLVCYTAGTPRETDDGIVYNGCITARLNNVHDINIYVEWDPAKEDGSVSAGHITGYEYMDEMEAFTEKGLMQFRTGDSIQFLFDYYDDEGNVVSDEEPYGSRLLVTKPENLKVTDAPLGECDIQFGGVLTDIYQREIMTEVVEAHITK